MQLQIPLLYLIEWRAGLRISEALAVWARDLSLDTARARSSCTRLSPALCSSATSARSTGSLGHHVSRRTLFEWAQADEDLYVGIDREDVDYIREELLPLFSFGD